MKTKVVSLFQVIRTIDVIFNVQAENPAQALEKCRLAGLSNKVQLTESGVDVTAAGVYPFAPFKPGHNLGQIQAFDVMENYFGENAEFDDYADLLAKVANGVISPGELKQKFTKANRRKSK